MEADPFIDFQQRLNILEPGIREATFRYAAVIYDKNKNSKVEALETGIRKAERENRQL